MRNISFHLSSEPENPQKRRKGSLTVLLCLTAGVCAILQILCAAVDIYKEAWIFCPTALAVCATIWYIWFYQRNLFPLTVALGTVISGAAAFVLRETLCSQVRQFTEYISTQTVADQPSPPVTETALLLIFPLSMLLFCLELLLKNHILLYLFTTTLYLFAPFCWVGFSFGTTMLLLFFQITFWVLQWSGGIRLPKKKDNTKPPAVYGHTCAKFTAGFLLLCIIAGLVLTGRYSRQFFTLGDAMEGFFHRTASLLSGQDGRLVTGGKISNGNQYPTGTGHLELSLSRQPTETLYLRGFSGGEYIGGDWTAADDAEILSRAAKALGRQEQSSITEAFYQNMYYSMNRYTQHPNAPQPFSLTIRHLNGSYEQEYVPYYSRRNDDDSAADDGYGYSFFEQKDMDIRRELLSPNAEQAGEWYRSLQQAYLSEIQTVYTQVPAERIPRLTSLAAKHPLESLPEISTFIHALLCQNAVYTSSPGVTPLNWDIAEYFLYVRHCGYCQHFALTATLLYRLYGIPARYATGYQVQASAFTLQEDGCWQAVVTDRNAHAWVEIFLEDYGWTPVEATPAADGSSAASYPGFDHQVYQQLLAHWEWSGEPSSSKEAPILPIQNPAAAFSAFWDDLRSNQKLWRSLWLYPLCVLLPALVLVGCNRLWQLKKTESMNCRRVYARLVEMLHFGGLLLSYDGSEKNFAKLLSAELPQLPPEDILRMCHIVCEAAYGPENPSKEKEMLVKSVYRQASKAVYERLNRPRKLLFRYWKAFL